MTSGKQRRAAIKAARLQRAAKRAKRFLPAAHAAEAAVRAVPVDPSRLAPYNSYGAPAFVQRGYYHDVGFTCVDCGAPGVWTAERQKWWYEIAQGEVWTTARRCKDCRACRREQRVVARKTHLEGLRRKTADKAPTRPALSGMNTSF